MGLIHSVWGFVRENVGAQREPRTQVEDEPTRRQPGDTSTNPDPSGKSPGKHLDFGLSSLWNFEKADFCCLMKPGVFGFSGRGQLTQTGVRLYMVCECLLVIQINGLDFRGFVHEHFTSHCPLNTSISHGGSL